MKTAFRSLLVLGAAAVVLLPSCKKDIENSAAKLDDSKKATVKLILGANTNDKTTNDPTVNPQGVLQEVPAGAKATFTVTNMDNFGVSAAAAPLYFELELSGKEASIELPTSAKSITYKVTFSDVTAVQTNAAGNQADDKGIPYLKRYGADEQQVTILPGETKYISVEYKVKGSGYVTK